MTLSIAMPPIGEKMRCPDIRQPIQQLLLELLKHGRLKPYEIQHALEALDLFWTGVVNRTKKLEDYKEFFKEG